MAMLQLSDSDVMSRIETYPAADPRLNRMTDGFLVSVLLHGLAIVLLVLGLPWLMRAPPPPELVIPVNLVALGAKTASPPASVSAPLPQQKAREVSKETHPEAVPVPATPPPPTAPQRADDRAAPGPQIVTKTEEKAPVATQPKEPKLAARPATKQARQPSPADDLSTRLKQLAQLKQPASPLPPKPRQQDGTGVSNLTATSADAARASDATYSVKDFIRAQVERRWTPNRRALKVGSWTVAIHIVLDPDGTVSRAEIVDAPRYRTNRDYLDFALSARNAVLLSSPLALPAGAYAIARDIVVDFDPKQVLQ